MVRTWFGSWGREKGFAYAERFRRLEVFQDPTERLKMLEQTIREKGKSTKSQRKKSKMFLSQSPQRTQRRIDDK
jgi:hypothetical protein